MAIQTCRGICGKKDENQDPITGISIFYGGMSKTIPSKQRLSSIFSVEENSCHIWMFKENVRIMRSFLKLSSYYPFMVEF